MELGLDFDDSFFTEKVRQKQTLTSYNAKVCYPEWFLSDLADNGRNDMATIYKFRGDFHYQRKDMESAILCYKNSLDNLGTHNRTMRRELMESLARCSMEVGQFDQSQQYSDCVMNECLTVEHYCQVLLLQQQLYRCSGDLLRELSVLHQLISIHPDNAQFWLKLAEVYEKIRDHMHSTSTFTESGITSSYRDQNRAKDDLNGEIKSETCIGIDIDTSQESTDFIKEPEVKDCSTQTGDGAQSVECPGQDDCGENKVNSCTVDKLQIVDLNEGTEDKTSVCTEKLSETLSDYQIDLTLLTCFVRTRLKLLSVQGTVGSFIKDRNIKLAEMMDSKIKELSVQESTLNHLMQFIRHDIGEEDNDDEDCKTDQSQDIKAVMENKKTIEEFNNRWFSWIKEVS